MRTHPTVSTFLLQRAGLVPIDNVDELPGIFVELELELSFFVNDQLSCRVENPAALIFVGIVNFNLACGQIVRSGLSVVVSFTESDQAVGNKAILRPVGVGIRRMKLRS